MRPDIQVRKRRRAVRRARIRGMLRRATGSGPRTVVLTVGGWACVDVAAFQRGAFWGWLVTGVSGLIIQWLGEK